MTRRPSILTDAPRVEVPKAAARIAETYPGLWKAYQKLGEEVAQMGPLDERTRRLVHLAYALGQASEGAVHSHVRRGLSEGISAAEFEHVAMLAATTLGWPQAIRGLSLVQDVTAAAGEADSDSDPPFMDCFGY